MAETDSDNRGVIIFGAGVLFIILIILVLFGVGKYTNLFKEKAVEVLKETAVDTDNTEQVDAHSADSPYLEYNLGDTPIDSSNLEIGGSPVDYGFKMDVEKSAQQQDAIEKYAFPTVPAGQPGSQEWQESFWKER